MQENTTLEVYVYDQIAKVYLKLKDYQNGIDNCDKAIATH